MDYNTLLSIWFYDFQNILDSYSNILEERNEEEQKQAKAQGYDPKHTNPKTMMDSAKNLMPKMPQISIPKFT